MRVADVMTHKVETVLPAESAAEAQARMQQGGFRHLVVVDREQVVGVLSDRDLRSAERRLGRDLPVAELMSRTVVTVTPNTSVGEAANLMRLGSINCLPVVQQGELVGIVTSGDLLELLALDDETAH
jgi:acetoin utilization protein AcuB